MSTSIESQGQTDTENYVITKVYLTPTTSTRASSQVNQVSTTVNYIDGLGRPTQSVAFKQSGNSGDLITHFEYDPLGRQAKKFLPYERSSGFLSLDGNAASNVLSFYNVPLYDDTGNPYSETDFESSPRGRVLRQAAPGNDWAMDENHEVKYNYGFNGGSDVYLFKLANSSGQLAQLADVDYYDINTLYKKTTYDENNMNKVVKGSVVTYTDKNGRVVLKRHYTSSTGRTTDPNPPIALDTYYIYDDFGNLAMVLPPKLSQQLVVGENLVGNHQQLIDNLGYTYAYDDRNRLKAKKLPGKQTEFIGYDILDRPVAVGPVKSPFGDEQLGMIITKYDKFDRVAYTLWRPVWIGESSVNMNQTPQYVSEERTSSTTIAGVTISYTNTVEPTSGVHVLSVNYYDDYAWNGAPSNIPTTVGDGDIDVYYNNGQLPKGLPTGGWVRILETTSTYGGKTSFLLYDQKGRPVRSETLYPNGGYTQIDTKFDFVDKVLYSITKHRKTNTSADPLQSIREEFTYNYQQQLIKHTHKVNNQQTRLLAFYTYDALGRLENKKTGGTDLSAANYLQKVDYSYNVRGWMTGINNANNLNDSPTDLFAMGINYNNNLTEDVNGEVEKLYNGNIAEISWRTSSDNIKRHYSYTYDFLNRLLDAWYSKPDQANPLTESYNEHLTYDANGNISSLKRNGSQELNYGFPIDDLLYTYEDSGESNRLKNVHDLEGNPDGFDDGATTSSTTMEYTYDDFGNMISDENKEIDQIYYNHLNLPTKVDFANGDRIEYLYSADGVKLEKQVLENSQSPKKTIYMDGYQYTSDPGGGTLLDFFMHAEGAVELTYGHSITPNYNYVFHHTDHLGNIRLRYGVDPSDGIVKILEENHYYPFGLQQKGYTPPPLTFKEEETSSTIVLTVVDPFLGDSFKYGFNGMERQEELGIQWQDFGGRNYDPAIGRWMNIDPMAETSRRFSPYTFALDNPIFFIDPDGMQVVQNTETGATMSAAAATMTGQMGNTYSLSNIAFSNSWANMNERPVAIVSRAGSGEGGCPEPCNGEGNFATGAVKGFGEFVFSMTGLGAVVQQGEMVGGLITGDRDFQIIPRPQPESNEALGFSAVMIGGAFAEQGPIGEIQAGKKVFGMADDLVGALRKKTDFVVKPDGTAIDVRLKTQAKNIQDGLNNGKNSANVTTSSKIIHYDLSGASHKGVNTPHVQYSNQNVNPETGEVFFNKVRRNANTMNQQDIRTLRKALERRKNGS